MKDALDLVCKAERADYRSSKEELNVALS